MNHKLIILLASCGMLAVVSCGGNQNNNKASDSTAIKKTAVSNLPKAETEEFKIDIPTGWQSRTNVMNGIKFLYLMAPKSDNFQPNLNVLKDDMHGRDMDAYIAFNINQLKSLNPQGLKQEDIEINGVKGKSLTYKAIYQGRDLQFGSYVIPTKNGMIYVITTTALISQYPALASTFNAAINSFTIK